MSDDRKDRSGCLMDGRAISFGSFRLFASQRLLLEADQPVRLGSRAFDILAALVERAGEVSSQRLLLEADQPVRLGSHAFDILAALVERAGEVVSKEELIARAWPTTTVEEGNLKLQISALRRALGDGGAARFIVTVPGRGYNFVAPIKLY